MFACAKTVPGHLIAQAHLLFHDCTRLHLKKEAKYHMIIIVIFIVISNDIYFVVVIK